MTGLTLEKIQSIFKEREIKTVGEHRYFSVLVPLVQKEDGLFVLDVYKRQLWKSSM